MRRDVWTNNLPVAIHQPQIFGGFSLQSFYKLLQTSIFPLKGISAVNFDLQTSLVFTTFSTSLSKLGLCRWITLGSLLFYISLQNRYFTQLSLRESPELIEIAETPPVGLSSLRIEELEMMDLKSLSPNNLLMRWTNWMVWFYWLLNNRS